MNERDRPVKPRWSWASSHGRWRYFVGQPPHSRFEAVRLEGGRGAISLSVAPGGDTPSRADVAACLRRARPTVEQMR